MSQADVIGVLEKAKMPMSRSDIAKELGGLYTNAPKRVSILINKLLKYGEVKCIEIPRDLAIKMYKCKRRMRLYYL